jgi:WD40 repeat protein
MPRGTDSVVGSAVAFSPDGKRLATSAEGNLIVVWKLAD